MYLSIDYGEKELGLAFSYDGKNVFPLVTIKNDIDVYKKIEKIVLDYNIKLIVVGLPYTLSGEKSGSFDNAEKFIKSLKENIEEVEVVGYDERYSSKIAKDRLKFYNKDVDIHQLSAVVVLEDYCQSQSID